MKYIYSLQSIEKENEYLLRRSIYEERRRMEKDKRETVDYFVSEIERCKIQLKKFSSNTLKDQEYTEIYKGIINDYQKRMTDKFSNIEIIRAFHRFLQKKNPFIFDDPNQK